MRTATSVMIVILSLPAAAGAQEAGTVQTEAATEPRSNAFVEALGGWGAQFGATQYLPDGSPMLWLLVLAVALLREQPQAAASPTPKPRPPVGPALRPPVHA